MDHRDRRPSVRRPLPAPPSSARTHPRLAGPPRGRHRPARRARLVVRRDQRAPGFPPVRTAQPRGAAGARRMDVGPRRQRPGRLPSSLRAAPAHAHAASGTGCTRATAADDDRDRGPAAPPGTVPGRPAEPDAPDDRRTDDSTEAHALDPRDVGGPDRRRSTSSAPTSRRRRPDAADAGPAARPPRPRVADTPTQPTTWTAPRPTTRTRTTAEAYDLDARRPRRTTSWVPTAWCTTSTSARTSPSSPTTGAPAGRAVVVRPVATLLPLLCSSAWSPVSSSAARRCSAPEPGRRRLRRPGHRPSSSGSRRRHLSGHRAHPGRRRRHRLHRPVPGRGRGQPRGHRHPAGRLPHAHADVRPARAGPDARPGHPADCSRSPCPRARRSPRTLKRVSDETGMPHRRPAGRRGGPAALGLPAYAERPARGFPLPGHLRLRARRRPGGHAPAHDRPLVCRRSTSCSFRSRSGSTV